MMFIREQYNERGHWTQRFVIYFSDRSWDNVIFVDMQVDADHRRSKHDDLPVGWVIA